PLLPYTTLFRSLGEFIISATPSTLELVQFFDVDRVHVAEQKHKDRQTNSGLGGCHGQHEEHKDLAGGVAEPRGKRHEIEVGGQEHELDGHQQNEQVAAVQEEPEDPDGEEYRRQNQEMSESQCHFASPWAPLAAAPESLGTWILAMRTRS